jgi:uncharacterized protein
LVIIVMEGTRADAEELVKRHMAAYDSSHDWYHVDRVRRQGRLARCVLTLALVLAGIYNKSPLTRIPADIVVVELAALFHDLFDRKYQSVNGTDSADLVSWFAKHEVPEAQASLVTRIVSNVSYSKEIALRERGEWTDWHNTCIELHCVMDADKLDAIGAFGIFRCGAYSGSKNLPLYLPKEHARRDWSAVGHFDDKLFKLEGMMMTETARKVAKRRTEIMRQTVERLEEEAQLLDFET